MRRSRAAATLAGAAVATVAAFGHVGPAGADGTEQLGSPTVAIASGSGIATGGVGLVGVPSGTIDVAVPSGATVKQVLLYWEGQMQRNLVGDSTIVVEGTPVTGSLIGGPTFFFWDGGVGRNIFSSAFRADITGLGVVHAGANSIDVSGLAYTFRNNGAGVVVIYDDGPDATIGVRDGVDLAFARFTEPRRTVVPQTYSFAAASVQRTATLTVLASSVLHNRPNAIVATSGGAVTTHTDVLGSADGPEWDSVQLPVTIPAGATSATVEVVSREDGVRLPASLTWVNGTLSVPAPPVTPPADVCTRTQGYWKTHATPGSKKFDATWNTLPSGPSTQLFGTGKTWTQAFSTEPAGNAYWILAHQYMAADLNKQAGADTTAVNDDLWFAAVLLDEYDTNFAGITGDVRARFTSLAERLDAFNNGRLGVAHCG